MPPRRDPTGDEFPPTVSDQLNQLIQISTTAATAQTDIKTQIAALVQATANLNSKLDAQTETTARLVNHVTQLTDNLDPNKPVNTRPNSPVRAQPNNNNNLQPRPPKITLPLFDGSNPLGWIFQAENYFTYYRIPAAERVSLTAFHFIGDALAWYQHLANNHLLGTWPEFVREVELRFGPSAYENHEASLFKLRQTTTVSAYQTEFERLSNRITGLSQQTLKNCFVSGLKPDIQAELAVHKPTTLHQACGLARLLEDKLLFAWKPKTNYPPKNPPTNTSNFTTTVISAPTDKTPASSTPPPLLPSPPKPLPFTKLSPEAIQQRRKEGLCFRCPEKFFPGHKCSPPQFLLIVDNDEHMAPDDPVADTTTDDTTSPQFLSLSDAAYFGLSSIQTLRVTGFIHGKPVTILIDCGSTHNIIQPRIATLFNLPSNPLEPFGVMVGNGQFIHCRSYCPAVPLQLQKTSFTIPFFVLPIEGADVVLGIAWLRTLGSITADFSIPQICFQKDGQSCTLKGEPISKPLSSSSLSSLIKHGCIASLHTLLIETQPNPTPPQSLPCSTDAHITTLLELFRPLFQDPHGLPPNRLHDHHIPLLNNNHTVNVKPYRYPHFQKQIMTRLITDMLTDGVIRPSQSPFSSPVLLVKKKDGSWRFCVDYRALNAATVRDRFPIPTIDELLDELHGATIFSKIDLRSGYHQIRVAKEDIHKTAFRTMDGHYEFLVMPFGLTNAPSTFQAAMNDLFRKVLRQFVLVFFDDILIYSASMEEHYSHLRYVFETLLANQFHAKGSKCVFAVQELSFLGHKISAVGVAPEPDKIEAIQSWPQPTSFTTLRAFLGLTGYYRRFVPHYARIASPLTDLLKKPEFTWTPDANQAFIELKTHMKELVTLALPDFSQPFDVTTDASGVAIGAVLSQNCKPIAFFSKKLCPTMQGHSTYTKELYAITEAIKKWRQYLLGRRFRIFTDHHSLKHVLTQTIQTPEQQKWVTKLMGYDFEIHFKPGKENTVADALSRVQIPVMLALSHPTATWLNEVRSYYQTDPVGLQLVADITADQVAFPHHSFRDGLVYVRGKLLIPPISNLRTRLLQEFHTSFVGGHAGVNATVNRLSSTFTWLGLKKDVTAFVKACDICQAIKTPNHKPYGLLQPLPTPAQPWHDISMDFITHLPPSKGKTAIWVIVDRLSKFAHFIALSPGYTAISLAAIFMREVYRLHGLPKTIISDRDPIFISRFWRQLFKLMASIESSLLEHQRVLHALKNSIESAKARMVRQANKNRVEKEFQVGDFVYLRLHKYRQQSVQNRSNQKLSRRFFGPFKILERIGKVAYKLELPSGSKVHPVFHVSLLKPSYGNVSGNPGDLSSFGQDVELSYLPEYVVNNRLGANGENEILVKWSQLPIEEATWENVDSINTQFPGFVDIEDNASSQEEGDDTSQPGPSLDPAQQDTRPKRSTKRPARFNP
ncbi:uncharacterized protein LOC118484192 [Helianthus annuus]|uniref:uncharacterized protein LOC118484192 n=1 Tax=Helianthus annuus TaxID=4232 RepID=UPI001652E055|nr:uncharacterized protein LOC118484192 [Helianthus annuus]